MSETVETTTVPFGISGQFLFNKETFSEISHLFAQLYSLRDKLHRVEEQLRRCNDPGWLVFFENRCQRLKRGPNHALVSLVEKLEAQKAIFQAAVDNIRQAILKLEPSALDTKTTLAGSLPMYPATPIRRREGNPEVVSRNAVIDDHPIESTKSICKLLDFHLGVPGKCTPGIPPSWVNRFGVTTFTDAYHVCPQLVHTLISKRRHKCAYPEQRQ
jgi:hypothetical protein